MGGRDFIGQHAHLASQIYSDEAQQPAYSGGTVGVTMVTLTDAQIKALPTTAVELVADPGAGRIVIPVCFFFHMTPSSYVAYTNIGAGCSIFLRNLSPVFSEADQGGAVSALLANPDFGNAVLTAEQSTSQIGVFLTRPNLSWGDADLSGALRINASGNTGNFTGGDPGNQMHITVWYLVADL